MDVRPNKGLLDERLLVVAPSVHDADVACEALRQAGLAARSHAGGWELEAHLAQGVSALVIAQEALDSETLAAVANALANQPEWSDLPLVVMTTAGMHDSPTSAAVLDLLPSGNVTLLERPFRIVTFVSAVRVALRARERQHRFRALFERGRAVKNTVIEGLYTVDREGRVTYINPAAEQMFGWTAGELLGKRMHDVTHYKHPDGSPFPAEDCAGLGVLRDRTILREYEDVFIRKDGSFFPVTFSAAPLLEHGEPVGIVVSFRDDTERKDREAERVRLLESEQAARSNAERANILKDNFLATLSHELRTPINAILGWTHLLKATPGDQQKVMRAAEVIERNSRTQAQLISDLLDMSRVISGKMRLDVQQVDLASIVETAIESVRPAAEANGIRIDRSLDPATGPVTGDPARLQQITWNLLSNAVKFTPRGGRVHVSLNRVNAHVEMRVSDSGKGISPDFLPHVFERFRQDDSSASRQHGGLGLGLAIVKQLVELHGGRVEASSPGEGAGATFTVALPVASVQEESSDDLVDGPLDRPAPPPCRPIDLKGLRVLVVDDEPDARDVLQRILEQSNAAIVVAASADEAAAVVIQAAPDVIVSDIGMPGQDGYQFIRRLREGGCTIPAVALTAFARPEDRAKAIHAGYQMHLPKPVEPTQLVSAVATLASRATLIHKAAPAARALA
jgi:PAS domain S-box-containing protein